LKNKNLIEINKKLKIALAAFTVKQSATQE